MIKFLFVTNRFQILKNLNNGSDLLISKSVIKAKNNRENGKIFLMNKNKIDEKKSSEKFLSWLLSNNVYIYNKSTWGRPPHPCIVSNETTDEGIPNGKGLLAFKNIQQGEKIIEIPMDLVLSKEHPMNKMALNEIDQMNEYDSMAIFLIQQRAVGDKSFWKTYFETLPSEKDLDIFFRWSIFDSFFLKGSKINFSLLYLREKIRSQFFRINNIVFEKNPILYPKTVFNIESWEWALSLLFSRSIFLSKSQELTMVPYADFLNHNPFSTSYIDAKEIPFSDFLEIAMYSDKPYNKFDQVFTTYGPKTNLELLLLYGFILERNPFDSTEIRVSLSRKDALYEKKKYFLTSCERPESITFPLFFYQYPKELYEFLRLCLDVSNKVEVDLSYYEFKESLDIEAEGIIKMLITMVCIKNLKKFNFYENEKKNLKLVDNEIFFSKTQKIAIKHVVCEKRILNKIIEANKRIN